MVLPANFPTRPWPWLFELAGLAGPGGLFASHLAPSFQRLPPLARRWPVLHRERA